MEIDRLPNTTFSPTNKINTCSFFRKVNLDIPLILTNSFLSILKIDKCNIGDVGVTIISKFLKNNTILLNLSITRDNFSYVGSHYLKGAIEINTTLEVLDLSGSLDNNNSPYTVLEGMILNKGIHTLNLSSNIVYNTTYVLLNRVLIENKTLRYLYIDNTLYDEIFYGIDMVWTNGILLNTTLNGFHFSPTKLLEEDVVKMILRATISNRNLIDIDFLNISVEDVCPEYFKPDLYIDPLYNCPASLACKVSHQIKYNKYLYDNTFLSYNMLVNDFHPRANAIIITAMLCNITIKKGCIPQHIIEYIFTFWKRKDFDMR